MDSAEIVKNLVKLGSVYCWHTGLDVFGKKEPLQRRRTLIFIGLVAYYWMVNIFTMYNAATENVSAIPLGISTIGFGIQLTVIMSTLINYRIELRDESLKIIHFYADQTGENQSEAQINKHNVQLMSILCKLNVCLLMTIVTGLATVPYTVHLLTGTYELPLFLKFPFVDEKHSPGYELLYVYEAGMAFYCAAFWGGFQIFFIVMVLHYGNLVDLLIHRSKENSTSLYEQIELHVRILEIHKSIEDYFGTFTSTQIICTVLQMSCSVYASQLQSLLANLLLFTLSSGQLFVTCCYGSYIEYKAERLPIALFDCYNSPDYSVKDRKCVILMLAISQHRLKLRVGEGFFEVGFNMFLKVWR